MSKSKAVFKKKRITALALEFDAFVDEMRGTISRCAMKEANGDIGYMGDLAILDEAIRASATLVRNAAADALVARRLRNCMKAGEKWKEDV